MQFEYIICFAVAALGIFTIATSQNNIKKLIGLAIFQTPILLFFISLGKVSGGKAPIINEAAKDVVYTNPLPQVLMLTAIVVGLATLAVGLTLAIKISKEGGK
jgi:multicomponent Na+:H+ antiporter subunit C